MSAFAVLMLIQRVDSALIPWLLRVSSLIVVATIILVSDDRALLCSAAFLGAQQTLQRSRPVDSRLRPASRVQCRSARFRKFWVLAKLLQDSGLR